MQDRDLPISAPFCPEAPPATPAAVLAGAYELLCQGMADRRAGLRTLTLATVDEEGAPDTRAVVLRALDLSARMVGVHSDVRAAKVAHIRREPRVALQGYDPGSKVQLRLRGTARVHHQDAESLAAWQAADIPNQGYAGLAYAMADAPGTPLPAPAPQTDADGDGRANFALIRIHFDHLEWLWLRHGRHWRARLRWPEGDFDAPPHFDWLVP